jgi:hypothetical protein
MIAVSSPPARRSAKANESANANIPVQAMLSPRVFELEKAFAVFSPLMAHPMGMMVPRILVRFKCHRIPASPPTVDAFGKDH